MKNDEKNIVLDSHNQPAQVETANMQLSLASRLALSIKQMQFMNILKSIDTTEAAAFISSDTLSNKMLPNKVKDPSDCEHSILDELSNNKVLPWSIQRIEQLQNDLDWNWLSSNSALPWSIELIERFEKNGIGTVYPTIRLYLGQFNSLSNLKTTGTGGN